MVWLLPCLCLESLIDSQHIDKKTLDSICMGSDFEVTCLAGQTEAEEDYPVHPLLHQRPLRLAAANDWRAAKGIFDWQAKIGGHRVIVKRTYPLGHAEGGDAEGGDGQGAGASSKITSRVIYTCAAFRDKPKKDNRQSRRATSLDQKRNKRSDTVPLVSPTRTTIAGPHADYDMPAPLQLLL